MVQHHVKRDYEEESSFVLLLRDLYSFYIRLSKSWSCIISSYLEFEIFLKIYFK